MIDKYKDNKLTSYPLNHNEWFRLGQYGIYKKLDEFILKDSRGKILERYSNLLSSVLALIEKNKGGKDGQ